MGSRTRAIRGFCGGAQARPIWAIPSRSLNWLFYFKNARRSRRPDKGVIRSDLDVASNLRRETVLTSKRWGRVEHLHHEVASQHEIDLRHTDALTWRTTP